jgi:hypothetical protein
MHSIGSKIDYKRQRKNEDEERGQEGWGQLMLRQELLNKEALM